MLIQDILKDLSQEEVLALLPETAKSLEGLTTLGQESLSSHLRAWQDAQAARLRHLQVQLTSSQMAVVEQALEEAEAEKAPLILLTPTILLSPCPGGLKTSLYLLSPKRPHSYLPHSRFLPPLLFGGEILTLSVTLQLKFGK